MEKTTWYRCRCFGRYLKVEAFFGAEPSLVLGGIPIPVLEDDCVTTANALQVSKSPVIGGLESLLQALSQSPSLQVSSH